MKNTIGRILLLVVLVVAPFGETAAASSFAAIASLYEPVRVELLEDSLEGVPAQARAIVFELRAVQADFSSQQAGVNQEAAGEVLSALPAMIKAADGLAKATTLEEARGAFYSLTKDLVRWRAGAIDEQKPAVAYCPMVKKSWLQPKGRIGNPYAGTQMPGCGEFVSE